MHRLLDVFNDLLRFSSSLDTLSRNFGHAKNIGTDVVVFYSSRCLNQQKGTGQGYTLIVSLMMGLNR